LSCAAHFNARAFVPAWPRVIVALPLGIPIKSAMRQVVIFIATGAWSGYAPVAPGTFGSIVGLIVGCLCFAPIWRRSPAAFLMVFLIVIVMACWIAGSADKILGDHDSSKIVLDEVLGMVATMFMNPTGWISLAAGFALFRIFDIIKPFPASFIDRRVRGGAGVMLDDIAAGIYANLVLQVARRLL
jgi:phosphatidylglycerophosphatase A